MNNAKYRLRKPDPGSIWTIPVWRLDRHTTSGFHPYQVFDSYGSALAFLAEIDQTGPIEYFDAFGQRTTPPPVFTDAPVNFDGEYEGA